MEVFALLLGDRKLIQLLSQELEISPELAAALKKPNAGVYFDWGPDSSRYLSHVDERPPAPNPDKLLEAFLHAEGMSE